MRFSVPWVDEVTDAVSAKEKKFSQPLQCGHCGNIARMEHVAEYSQTKEYSDDNSSLQWEAGAVFELLVCPACQGVTLRRYYYHEIRDPEEWPLDVLYPQPEKAPSGLPAKIEAAYQEAARVKNVPNAYAVLLGRLLEMVCEDRQAVGNTLARKLDNLADRGEIPGPLAEIAHNLRGLRNIGAHAGSVDLTAAEIPLLDDLCRAVLEYVYSAPHLVERVKKRLDEMKGGS